MEKHKVVFAITLTISILLEIWVRWISPFQFGQDFFGVWPPIDNIMHFLWGLNFFFIFTIGLKWKPWDGILGVFMWQMLWETVEMIGDKVQSQPAYMLDHFFYDGIKDTCNDLAGALVAWYLLYLIFNKNIPYTKDSPCLAWVNYYAILLIPLLIIGSYIYFTNGHSSPDTLSYMWLICAFPVALVINFVIKKFSKK